MSIYKKRDIEQLDKKGNYYSCHINAIKVEGLCDESDIAAELAYRDCRINELERTVREFLSDMKLDLKKELLVMKLQAKYGCGGYI